MDIEESKECEKGEEDQLIPGEKKGEEEDEEVSEEDNHSIPELIINMGRHLHILLNNIHKLPTPLQLIITIF